MVLKDFFLESSSITVCLNIFVMNAYDDNYSKIDPYLGNLKMLDSESIGKYLVFQKIFNHSC